MKLFYRGFHLALFILNHFVSEGYSRSGIYKILALLDKGESIERKPGVGRHTVLTDTKVQQKLRRITEGKVAKSYRSLARSFGTTGQTVKKYLRNMGIVMRKRKSKPEVSNQQIEIQKQRIKKMAAEIFPAKRHVKVLMDDETYLTLDGNDWQGTGYFTSPHKPVENKVKYISHTKFPKKVLLWLTISEKGMSNPILFPSGLAVNAEVYSTQCLPEVSRFIKKFHAHDDIVFWPDLASAHYAKKSLEEMNRLSIPVVPKDSNPPNLLKLRPIENFWANLKRRIYADNFVAKSTDELIKRTQIALKISQ
jgi:transposase